MYGTLIEASIMLPKAPPEQCTSRSLQCPPCEKIEKPPRVRTILGARQRQIRKNRLAKLARLIVLAPIVSLLISTPISYAANVLHGSRSAKLQRLRSEIRKLRIEQTHELTRKNRVLNQLRTVETRISKLNQDLTTLSAKKETLITETRKYLRLRHEEASTARKARLQLSKLLRVALVLGAEPRVKLFLQGDSPAKSAQLLALYGYYAKARANQIAKLSTKIEHYQKVGQMLKRTQTKISNTAATENRMLADLVSYRKRRKGILSKLRRNIDQKKDRISMLQQAARRLENLVTSVDQDLQSAPARRLDKIHFAGQKGRLPWPVDGRIISQFGSPRAGGELQWHAVEIAATGGSQVRAIASGRIAYAGWLPYYGLVLIIDHGQGYLTIYGHNSAIYGQVGDWVTARQVIATVGTSGGQSSPAVYFQIRHNNHPLNPNLWCITVAHSRK